MHHKSTDQIEFYVHQNVYATFAGLFARSYNKRNKVQLHQISNVSINKMNVDVGTCLISDVSVHCVNVSA